MKAIKTSILAAICSIVVGTALADSGTIAVTNVDLGPIKRTDVYWYGGATDTVWQTSATMAGFNGEIRKVTFKAIGATNTYSVYLNDAYGSDVLQAQGVAITTNTPGAFTPKVVCPAVHAYSTGPTGVVPMVVSGPLYLVATNTHVGASGVIVIHYVGK